MADDKEHQERDLRHIMDRLDPRSEWEKLSEAYFRSVEKRMREFIGTHDVSLLSNIRNKESIVFIGGKKIASPISFGEADYLSDRDTSNTESED